MAPSKRSETRRPGLTRFQVIRYSIYTLLTLNMLYYLWEDLIAFQYVPRGAPLAQIVENFAVTIDYVAWMVLIVLFEIETDFMPKEKFKGGVKWAFNSALVACYLVLVYAFYGYVAALVDFYRFVPFPPEQVCSLVDGNFAYVTMDARFLELTSGQLQRPVPGRGLQEPRRQPRCRRLPTSRRAYCWVGWTW